MNQANCYRIVWHLQQIPLNDFHIDSDSLEVSVGEYGCLGTVQLRKFVSCISMAEGFSLEVTTGIGRLRPAMWMAFCWL